MDETPARPGTSVNSGAQCAGIGGSYKHARAGSRSRVTVGARRGSRDRSSSSGGHLADDARAVETPLVVRSDNEGWSLYGAQRLHPVAIGGNGTDLKTAQKRRKPLPWVATSCPSRSMVSGALPKKGRGSPRSLRKKRQVLRTRRPTGLDAATLTRGRLRVNCARRSASRHAPPSATSPRFPRSGYSSKRPATSTSGAPASAATAGEGAGMGSCAISPSGVQTRFTDSFGS